MTGMGAFAEKIVAPEGSVMPIPESMDYETAAAPFNDIWHNFICTKTKSKS